MDRSLHLKFRCCSGRFPEFSSLPLLTLSGSIPNLLDIIEQPELSSFSRIVGRFPFTCFQCGHTYRHQASLRNHVRFQCGKEPQFECPYCSKKCKLKGNLKKHILSIHTRELGS